MSISRSDKLFLTKNLSVLIKAGVPMREALETVGEQSGPELRKLMEKVETDVVSGVSLSVAFGKHKESFDAFYISLIKAGEESGTLDDNMVFLAEQLNKDYALRGKVMAALAYPSLVVGATLIMGMFLSWFVLPKLTEMFSSFEVALPLSTQILMGIAWLMKNYGPLVMVGFVGLVALISFAIRVPKIRLHWDSMILKIPVIGKIVADGELGRFCRNMGTMLKSGIPMMKSFEITAGTLTNLRFKRDLLEMEAKVSQGKSIYEAMSAKKYDEFPKMVSRMIRVGEKSGNLEDMLIYLSGYYEDEIDVASKNLATLLEPILLLVIGSVVAFVALAIITPIYSLMGNIR